MKKEYEKGRLNTKIYYLKFIRISIKEKENQDLNVTFHLSNDSNSIDNDKLLNEIPNAQRTVIDKILYTTMKQTKLLLSNKLSYYVLNKFFNKVIFNKDKINDELFEDDDIKKLNKINTHTK